MPRWPLGRKSSAHNDVPSKGRTNNTARGTILLPAIDRQHATEVTGSSSPPGTAASAQPPLFEGQILQILIDMKEQMKEQQI